MDLENILRDMKLGRTEITVLCFIQNDPEQCIRQGVHTIAEQCYSNPSPLVRLAEKLRFNDWLELVYFIRFNIIMLKLNITNDINHVSVQLEEALTLLLASLKQQRILIHGNGFSQLIVQYIYNKFLVTGMNASLTLRSDYEIFEQKNTACPDSIWIVFRFGRSSSAPNWAKTLERKEINLVRSTGGYRSPLTRIVGAVFIIHNPQKFDDDIYWSNSSFGYYVLGPEQPLKAWSISLHSSSQPPLNATRVGGVPGWRLAPYPGYWAMW